MQKFKLWTNSEQNKTEICYYPTTYKVSKGVVVIFPGGAYFCHADYEGEGYAAMINTLGLDAFVVHYRVLPERFPLPLLDARRAVRFIRANADKFGLDKDKMLVMGSSAGGHLAALLSTYYDEIEGECVDEIDREDYMPNGQILCYPVVCSDENVGHMGSYENLLGDKFHEKDSLSPELLVSEKTPKAFIWHTSSDELVNVINSYRYAEALAEHDIPCELHVFPVGRHGSALAPNNVYVSSWIELLRKWLLFNGWIDTIA
jgi:acetyl esterase/lipase